jgi:hypothetical protein
LTRLINLLVVVLILLLAGGLGLSAISKVRAVAAQAQCQNNLKQIGLSLLSYHDSNGSFPLASLPNENLSCSNRLSWMVDTLPYIEQGGVTIDRKKGWQDEANIIPKFFGTDGETPPTPLELKLFRCPADQTVSPTGAASLTNYVGITGLGPDAAELRLGYPGVGFFGCDRKLKIENIKDGTASTIMLAETNIAIGPWTAGGLPTSRGLNPDGGRYLGADSQFGSGHRSCNGWFTLTSSVTTNVVFADGAVRGLTESISPKVLEALVTVAGDEQVGPVGF